MAKLREAKSYRNLKRPNTRTSKYRKKAYIRGIPGSRVVMYDSGNKKRTFPIRVTSFSKAAMNLRHNAIEAGRQAANRYLEKTIGRENFHLKIRAIPHHIMRENPLATGAGADRFQTGMTKSYGKPYGLAARIHVGKPVMSVYVEEKDIKVAKEALRKAVSKFPFGCTTDSFPNK